MCLQRHMTKTSTQITTELFEEWKRQKAEIKEAELATKRAERAKNDRMRFVFLWLFLDFKINVLATNTCYVHRCRRSYLSEIDTG